MKPPAPIQLSGVLSVSELRRFQYFHTLRRTWPIALLIALILLVLVPLLAAAAISNPEGDWHSVLINALPFISLLIVWTVLMGLMPLWYARREMAQKCLKEPITYTFDAEALSGTGPSSSWKIAWDLVKAVRETRSLFAVYPRSNMALIVPKRFFRDAAEMAQWRELVLASIAPKRIEKPGPIARWC